MHAHQTEDKDRNKAEQTRHHKTLQHGLFLVHETPVGQDRIVERIAEHLQQRDQQQVKTGIQPELAIAEQGTGVIGRNDQEQHGPDKEHEHHRLNHIGEDRRPQPALQAVGQGEDSEQHGRNVVLPLPRQAKVTTHYGGVTPDLVVQPDQNRRGKRQ